MGDDSAFLLLGLLVVAFAGWIAYLFWKSRDAVPESRPPLPKVSLGCGSLFLIALIVAVLSRNNDVEQEVRQLQGNLRELAEKVDAMDAKIDLLIERFEVGEDRR